ncbi:inositol monophosphatase family protein [Streptococcus iniae]|uniref:Inositol monophosphatase n=1 Tax=Streptococcus iniae TaxID=1346 RepID=A0A3L8GJR3_STRIN|nr:inositol monophosphatase family protein [Streptococcus iniae]AGM98749.1 inositol monophosphatase family protein [Streptococcus iniae SF1]AHY15714.1 inositol monophosphatase [Streptococcus iniae]AHY17582.1 inositol monophosphatase [Streptococcus iniae]AJG25880.1 inositol monophosphatase [Streptococcus iniae]APD31753.1 inositol monophosphatase [Streptococcus iniae]
MEDKFAFAKEIVLEAAAYIKKRMSRQLAIEIKTSHDDLVTDVDHETQDLIIDRIRNRYPSDHILAEENNVRHPIDDGHVWVLDPIDGTINFIVQRDYFAIMLSYFEEGKGQFGIIYDVINDRFLVGGGQFEVTLNHQKVSPYEEKPLNRSLVACNSGMYRNNDYGLVDFIGKTLGLRIYGGAGISMMMVMTQQLFAYFSYIQPWDYAAALVLGKPLGYTLLTMDGKEPDFSTRQKVMFIPECHRETIQSLLNSCEN